MNFVTLTASGQDSLTIIVKKVRNDKGVLRATLFKQEVDYMTNFTTNKVVNAATGEVTLTFDHLSIGEYAITIMHDENNNNKLDSNFIGIPKEGTGFSNDASALFGPPSWGKAKFKWNRDSKPQTITLKYF